LGWRLGEIYQRGFGEPAAQEDHSLRCGTEVLDD